MFQPIQRDLKGSSMTAQKSSVKPFTATSETPGGGAEKNRGHILAIWLSHRGTTLSKLPRFICVISFFLGYPSVFISCSIFKFWNQLCNLKNLTTLLECLIYFWGRYQIWELHESWLSICVNITTLKICYSLNLVTR